LKYQKRLSIIFPTNIAQHYLIAITFELQHKRARSSSSSDDSNRMCSTATVSGRGDDELPIDLSNMNGDNVNAAWEGQGRSSSREHQPEVDQMRWFLSQLEKREEQKRGEEMQQTSSQTQQQQQQGGSGEQDVFVTPLELETRCALKRSTQNKA
jgi:hypothetical protein